MAKPLRKNNCGKTLRSVVLPAVCILFVMVGAKNAMGAYSNTFDYDKERFLTWQEVYRRFNPLPKGQEDTPIPEIDAYDDHGYQPLIRAISAGNKEEIVSLLQRKANPNVRDPNNQTPLYAAANIGDLEIVKLLIEHGARPGDNTDPRDAAEQRGESTDPLYAAAKRGDMEMVKLLIEHGARPGDSTDPLHAAAKRGDMEMVMLLIEHGARPSNSLASLAAAVDRNDMEMVALFIRHGARPSLWWLHDYPGHTKKMEEYLKKYGVYDSDPRDHRRALLRDSETEDILEGLKKEEELNGMLQPSIPVAVMLDHSSAEIAALIARGSDVNEIHHAFGTALHQSIILHYNTYFVEFLLQSGANPNLASVHGKSPLEEAVDAQREDLACLLLGFGARFKEPGVKPEKTAFHNAIAQDMPDTVQLMLAAGADPNEYALDSQGRPLCPPLFLTDSPAVLRLLLAAGADPKAEDQQGRNALGALDWKRDNSIPAALVLLAGGVSGTHASIYKEHQETLIHWAIYAGNHELFLAARKAGVSVTELNEKKLTPLFQAVSWGDAWTTRELLKTGAPVKGSALYPGQSYTDYGRGSEGIDAIAAQAVQSGSLEVLLLLLDAGVDMDVKANGYDQVTALHLAVAAKRADMADALLRAGARTDLADRYGRTPLHLAAESGHTELADLLLNAGADPKAQDDDGKSPLDTVKDRNRSHKLVRLLERRL